MTNAVRVARLREYVKAHIDSQNMTAKEWIALHDLPKQTVYRLGLGRGDKYGVSMPSLPTLYALAQAMSVNLHVLVSVLYPEEGDYR